MNSNSKHIISFILWMGLISLIYFVCLITYVPFIITAVFIGTAVIKIHLYNKSITTESINNSWLYILMLLSGTYLFINNVDASATKNGLWDAWAIWNLHTNYLIDSQHWQAMFKNADGAHPDYPLALPGLLAFWKRLLNTDSYWIFTHAIHTLITFSIPILILSEVFNKNKLIAGAVFLLLCNNIYFINHGVSQFADTLLSLFFLCSLICIYHAKNHKQVLLSAAFLGMCIWTKNEGIIIAVIMLLFNYDIFFKKNSIKYTLLGLTPILVIVLIFKLFYAPANDLINAQDTTTESLLFETGRYRQIYNSFISNLNEHFGTIKKGVIIYALLCLITLKSPHKLVLMILAICTVYMLIYVVTPYDLDWHLFTSQGRLMHQLAGPLLFILATEVSKKIKLDVLPATESAP